MPALLLLRARDRQGADKVLDSRDGFRAVSEAAAAQNASATGTR